MKCLGDSINLPAELLQPAREKLVIFIKAHGATNNTSDFFNYLLFFHLLPPVGHPLYLLLPEYHSSCPLPFTLLVDPAISFVATFIP